MTPFTFTMRLTVGGSAPTVAPPPRPPSRVLELLEEHRPQKMVDNMALIIMDQTYSALLEILGPEAKPSSDGHVHVCWPLDPADPESPLLSVNAIATHCCIILIDSLYGGGASDPDYMDSNSPRQSSNSQYRLARTTITTSPGTLHVARVDGGGRGDYWSCEDVRPDVTNKGLFGVLEMIKARLDAAIRLEAMLLAMAKSSGCCSPKVREAVEVGLALQKMRAAVDLDAFMRRRCRQYRRVLIQEEITCRLDVDQGHGIEVLAEGFGALHVGQKRGRNAYETNCQVADDAEEMAKRQKALQNLTVQVLSRSDHRNRR